MAVLMLILLLTSLLITYSVISVEASSVDEVRKEFIDVYVDVAKLGREGINVTSLVHELSKALKLIDEGSNESLLKAKAIIDHVKSEVKRLKAEAPRIILMDNLRKYLIVAALACIPIAFYFLLPRAYLALWFRVRRRWVVES